MIFAALYRFTVLAFQDCYEVKMKQRKVRENLPLIIAFFVYCYAKLVNAINLQDYWA